MKSSIIMNNGGNMSHDLKSYIIKKNMSHDYYEFLKILATNSYRELHI
jgi:hypothetical protein